MPLSLTPKENRMVYTNHSRIATVNAGPASLPKECIGDGLNHWETVKADRATFALDSQETHAVKKDMSGYSSEVWTAARWSALRFILKAQPNSLALYREG